jgi:ribosome-binding ATPase YchF (GTP1/OBG family)
MATVGSILRGFLRNTLFVQNTSFPFCTIEPNVGIAEVREGGRSAR